MGWLTGWSYRKAVTLSRASGAVTNYQMKLLVGEGDGTGNDANVVSLLHMNGADESTVFTDDAVGGTHAWTATGTAKIDSTDSKFGGTSGLFDGNSDYISAPDSADWDYGTGAVTIDFWMKLSDLTTYQTLYSHRSSGGTPNNGRCEVFYYGALDDSIRWIAADAGGTTILYYSTQTGISDTNWHHIALVRNGANVYIFFDGVSQTLTVTTSINAATSLGGANDTLKIGNYTSGTYWFAGNLQEYRISKGIARWTSNFTPPTAPYGQFWKNENVNSAGHALSTFNDIRFTAADGTTLLDYWIESLSGTTPNQLATIWIEFNSIGTGDTTFYMYYGKSDAPAVSSGVNTFIVFDNFERGNDGDAVGGDWTIDQGNVDISTDHAYGGTRCMKLLGDATYPIVTIPVTASANIAIRCRLWKEALAQTDIHHGDGTTRGIIRFDTAENITIYDGVSYVDTTKNITADTWQLIEINNWNWTAKTIDVYANEVAAKIGGDISFASVSYQNEVALNQTITTAGVDSYVDDFIVRNWRATEPAWGSWGAETGAPATSPKHGFTSFQDPGIC